MAVNNSAAVTAELVDAARESLVVSALYLTLETRLLAWLQSGLA